MSTNNTSDYEKDYGIRVTLPHVIGFRNSIKIIIPEGIVAILCWISLYFIGSINPEMGREWGPRPLLLIYSFHLIMSFEFLVMLFA